MLVIDIERDLGNAPDCADVLLLLERLEKELSAFSAWPRALASEALFGAAAKA